MASSELAGVPDGRLRWAVNSKAWNPKGDFHGEEFQFLLSLIREIPDREQVAKFNFFEDQKRALISRLLVRQASALVLGLKSFATIEIARTKGKKPFLKRPRPPLDQQNLANFNFNVSHEGDWVVLASEPICVCGVDVAAPEQRRNGARQFDFFTDMKDQLSTEEWLEVGKEASLIRSGKMSPLHPDEQPGYTGFQRHWSCKEAYVKARGDGLGFEPLGRASFTFNLLQDDPETGPAYAATVIVDKRPAPEWYFYQHRLGENHWVTVARGPTHGVIDEQGDFKKTLLRLTNAFTQDEWKRELSYESPCFQIVSIGFLVPDDDIQGYIQAGGERSEK